MLKRFAERIIYKYGFEHHIMIAACRLADLFDVEIIDIEGCPFKPDHIEGRPVLAILGNKAIVG